MKLWCSTCQKERKVPFQPSREDLICPECDRPLQSTLAKNRGRHPQQRRRAISPASPAQKRKIAQLGYCIACKVERSDWVTIDPAHLAPRGHGGCDKAVCVVGLCRRADGGGCHRMFDDGELDLLSIIVDRLPAELEELQHMLEHLTPVEMIERLANERTQWQGLAA